jgi:hypothetical protein
MLLKRKILLPLSGISLASPQHITLHLKKKCMNRVSPIQSTISCTISLITYTVLLSVSCDDGVFFSELMNKTMHLSHFISATSHMYPKQRLKIFLKSGNHTHIWYKKKQLVFLAPSCDSHLCSMFIFFLLLYYLP